MEGTPGEGDSDQFGDGVGVIKGVVDGLAELETKPETGINFDCEFLMLALNFLSIVNLRLRLAVLMGVLRFDNFKREFTKEFPPNVLFSLKVWRSVLAVFLRGLFSLFSSWVSMKDFGGVTFSFFFG